MIKRVFDLLVSALALVLLAPVMAVIAVLVKRDSEGPALFAQERVGREGRPFRLLKFRSMKVTEAAAGPLVTAKGDVRVTNVGATLRATKLDELPQLINVVRGDMSIVGPRPEVAPYVALWPAVDRDVILSVRPGLTDPATLALRREEELLAGQDDPESFYRTDLLPQKARIYRQYVENRSMGSDVGIILNTITALLRGSHDQPVASTWSPPPR